MDQDQWLEISLSVEGELAEAVADVLARFVPNGVAMETELKGYTPEGEGIPLGLVRVCGYLPMDDRVEETRHRLEEALWYLGRIRPLPDPQWRTLKEANWADAWKKHYQPIPIGKRLVIVPAWLENPQPDRVAVRMDPGMAFGTGTHPTTQLCLEALEEDPPKKLIDVGCGSGILSIAALKLGAERAVAVDIDPLAVKATLENADLNGVSERIEARVGSLEDILTGIFNLQQAPHVIANILAPVIIDLLDQGLADLVSKGGKLILSGILAEQAADVATGLNRHGLRVLNQKQMGDWVALISGE